jgi:hypothetical protein
LAAEDALAFFAGLYPPEDVDLNRLEVEQVDQKLEGGAHASMIAGPTTQHVKRRCADATTLRRHDQRA